MIIEFGIIFLFLIVIYMWFKVTRTSSRKEYLRSNRGIKNQKIKLEQMINTNKYVAKVGYKVDNLK